MDTPKFTVSEGVESTFHYHLSREGNPYRSLCDKQTMFTNIPLSAWGVKSHLKEKWCEECKTLAEPKKDS